MMTSEIWLAAAEFLFAHILIRAIHLTLQAANRSQPCLAFAVGLAAIQFVGWFATFVTVGAAWLVLLDKFNWVVIEQVESK
jgi:hypothetical protein